MSLSSKRLNRDTEKPKRVNLLVVRCQANCYNLQVFTVESRLLKPDDTREYLRDQKCQHCGLKFAEMFKEDIKESAKKITFLESCFGEILLKNNFVHYMPNLCYPLPSLLKALP